METDGPLKLLFQHCADLLLPLTGDVGATVRSAGPAEIHAFQRRADCVLELEKDGETYYRHLEFEDRPNAAMATRCFEYNTQLVLQHKAAVLTTVIYIEPPKPKAPLVFRVVLGDREINRWAFEQICLWEMDARQGLESALGLAPLTPLMHGGRSLDVVQGALRRIPRVFPPDRVSIAEDVLLALAGQHYTVSQLASLVGRDRMKQSSLYTEGHLEGEREVCAALTLKYHAAVFERAMSIIDNCQDSARLKEWALSASDTTDDGFLKLLGA
jgi:hypothetical protein